MGKAKRTNKGGDKPADRAACLPGTSWRSDSIFDALIKAVYETTQLSTKCLFSLPKGTNEKQSVLHAATVLKSVWIALYFRNESLSAQTVLKELYRVAHKYLRESTDNSIQKTGTATFSMEKYFPGLEGAQESFWPIVPIDNVTGTGSVGQWVTMLLNGLSEMLTDSELGLSDSAHHFVESVLNPWGLRDVLEKKHGILLSWKKPNEYYAKVIKAFEKIKERKGKLDVEELAVAAFREIGLSKDQAHSLVRAGIPGANRERTKKSRDMKKSGEARKRTAPP